MRKQLIGIALIILGIYFIIPYELFYGWGTVIGLVLGVIGLIIVVVYSGKDPHSK
jgi:peptidoglycan/LPS O-acetylase OafA/YrhL